MSALISLFYRVGGLTAFIASIFYKPEWFHFMVIGIGFSLIANTIEIEK